MMVSSKTRAFFMAISFAPLVRAEARPYDTSYEMARQGTNARSPMNRAELEQQLEELQKQFGQYMNFPGMGVGRLMQNSLTRGMRDPPTDIDPKTDMKIPGDYAPSAIGAKGLKTGVRPSDLR